MSRMRPSLPPLRRAYLHVLDRVLAHSRRIVLAAFLIFGGTLALIPFIGTEFLPPLEEGAIAINVVRLPNASLAGSVEVGTYMEKQLLTFPEVKTVVTKTGRAEISEDPMGPEQNDVLIMLHPESEWTTGRSKEQLVAAIEALNTPALQRISGGMPDGGLVEQMNEGWDEMNVPPGFPVEIITSEGGTITTITVVSVEQGDLDPADFEPPPDYQKMQMPIRR